jgi:signal transduction histidine kinase
MRPSFHFFGGHKAHPLEAEFRAAYQESGAKLLAWGLGVGVLVFAAFYVLDLVADAQPWTGGLQTARLLIMGGLLALIAWLVQCRAQAQRWYPLITTVSMTLALLMLVYLPYAARHSLPLVEVYWSLTSSMVTGIICVFASSRLTAFATLLISLVGTLNSIAFAMMLQGESRLTGRLITHLLVANVICYVLRASIQHRERTLFVQSKEVLEAARYTQTVEVARLSAEHADQAKSRFLATMSHEVRTPIHAMLQILELVRRDLPTEKQSLVTRGSASGQAMLRMLNGILDYSKLSSGAATVRRNPVDLVQTAHTVADLFAASAAIKNIDLQLDLKLAPLTAWVLTDEVKLLEILNNLVSNAIKFTDTGSVSLVVVTTPQRTASDLRTHLQVQVRDTGIGMSPEGMKGLYTAFHRIEAAHEIRPGTGLGLALAKEMATALGGELSASSALGLGTTFTLNLPLEIDLPAAQAAAALGPPAKAAEAQATVGPAVWPAVQQAAAQAAAPAAPIDAAQPQAEKPAATGPRVLLAEDDELNTILAGLFLESHGCRVQVARHGREVVDLYSAQPNEFDIILMDCRMPVLDGNQATQLIRELERAQGLRVVPIVAATANSMSGDREACLVGGMSDFLSKPYTKAELGATLQKWVPHFRPAPESASQPAPEPAPETAVVQV